MKIISHLSVLLTTVIGVIIPIKSGEIAAAAESMGITVHYRGDYANPYIHYWDAAPLPNDVASTTWPGEQLVKDTDSEWYTKSFADITSIKLIFNNNGSPQTGDMSRTTGEWWFEGKGTGGKWYSQDPDTIEEPEFENTGLINIHVKATTSVPKIRFYGSEPVGVSTETPINMLSETSSWYRYNFNKLNSIKAKFTIDGQETAEYAFTNGEWYLKDGVLTDFHPKEGNSRGNDFREETIYFVMTARFYDGDPSNNVHCWDDAQAKNPDSDPAWRGDFKGLIEKLDYIKALGFSALWITPVVENASGYDYHGYHAIDMSQVDPRLEVPGATYQDLINAAHAKGMKIIQDVVFNHTSNFGEENLFPMFEKDYTKPDTVANLKITDPYKVLPDDYSSLSGDGQYGSRINAMKEDMNDFRYIYHHEKSMGYEQYIEQTGQIAGDCVDLNTENPYVTNYLIDAYSRYIDMGVDGFRVDTAKHISRLVFDKVFNPAFQARGGKNFFMFGEVCTRVREVWNHGQAADSAPFYTWKEQKNYPWATMQERAASTEANWYDNLSTWTQPTSSNHYLDGNNYRPVDYSKKSDLNVIDFPMHWNFKNA